MGNSKKKTKAEQEIQTTAKAEKKAAKARVKFERKEAKLKREKMQAELVMWDVELDLLVLYAEQADDEKRAAYEETIAQLEEHLENAYAQFKMLKKIKKLESPAALIAGMQPTWAQTETAFDQAEETLDSARPNLDAAAS